MTTIYQAAMEKSRIAISAFAKIQADYRNRKIGDAQYFEGLKSYKAAMAEYDAAFAAAQKLISNYDF